MSETGAEGDAGVGATEDPAEDMPAEDPAEDAPTERDPEPDADEPDHEAELEQDLEAGIEPSGPDAKRGPADVGRATPAKGGRDRAVAPAAEHRTASGGGGGGGGGRGGGTSGRGGNHFSLFNLGAIFRFGNILSGNSASATGVNTGGPRKRRPAPARRPTAVARARGRR